MLLAVAKRFGVILLGYGAACVAAGIAIQTIPAIVIAWQGASAEQDDYAMSPLSGSILFTAFIAIFMAIPTFLTLPFLEAGEVRNPLVYGLVGGAWGFLMFFLIFKTLFSMTLVFALSGVIAGLVYWAVAGRSAGQVWR
jgi:hypothetical protein